jgi:hypothetical protein
MTINSVHELMRLSSTPASVLYSMWVGTDTNKLLDAYSGLLVSVLHWVHMFHLPVIPCLLFGGRRAQQAKFIHPLIDSELTSRVMYSGLLGRRLALPTFFETQCTDALGSLDPRWSFATARHILD